MLTGSDPLRAAGPLNVLLYLAVVGVLGCFVARRFGRAPAPAAFAMAASALSFPLYLVAIMGWSELLFILLVAAASVCADVYNDTGRRRMLVAMALFSAAACLSRYAGIVLVGWGALIIMSGGSGTLKTRIGRAATYATLASLPLALWAARNYAVSGTFFGPRSESQFTVWQNTTLTLGGVLSWYAPVDRIGMWGPLLLAALTVAAAVAVVRRSPHAARNLSTKAVPVAAFVGLYVCFIVGASAVAAHDEISDRLLAPIVLHVSLLGAYGLAALLASQGDRKTEVLRKAAVAVLFAGMVGWPLARTARTAVRVAQTGEGLASNEWRSSATAKHLVAQRPALEGARVYSNAPDAVYVLTGLRASWSPAAAEYHSAGARRDVRDLRGQWPPEGRAVLVWFDCRTLDSLYSVESLTAVADVQEVARLADGAVFNVTARASSVEHPSATEQGQRQ